MMFPNGIIGHLFGLVEGQKHDTVPLKQCGLIALMENPFHDGDGALFNLFDVISTRSTPDFDCTSLKPLFRANALLSVSRCLDRQMLK